MRARLGLGLRRPWSSIAATSALIAAMVSGRAAAQSADAEALFNDGDKLLKQGKVVQACDAFEASNRIEPRAGTLIRLGECREQNGQLAAAWSAYKDALTRVKDPRKQKLATARVTALEPRLSYLTVNVPAKNRVDGLALTRDGKPFDPGLWNRAVPIDGGDYEIAATAPGYVGWKETAKVPTEHGDISLTMPGLAAEPSSPTVVGGKHPVKDKDDDEPRPAPSSFTTKRKVAVAVLVVGAGATVAGALLGSSAQSKKNDAYGLCPDPAVACAQASAANSLISTAHTRAFEADAGFAIGAVAAVVAGTLWFTGAPEHSVNVTANVGAHGGGFAVVGSF